MRSRPLSRTLLSIAAFTMLLLPSAADAATFRQIGSWFPQIGIELAGDDALPEHLDKSGDGPVNAIGTTDGSGLYVVAPDASLLAPDGQLIDPVPDIDVASGSLSFDTGGALEDVHLPKAGNGWLVLSASVGVRLAQRDRAPHSIANGAVLYRGVRAGVDQLFIANPDADAVKEWLIATGRARVAPYAYELRMPRSYKAVLRSKNSRSQIDILNSRHLVVVSITAPVAIDEKGTNHAVRLSLTPDERGFVMQAVRSRRMVGALAIDPLYIKTANNAAYPLFQGAKPYFSADTCGDLADEEHDFPGWDGQASFADNPWMEGPGDGAPFPACGPVNGDNGPNPLVSFVTSPDDAGKFDTSWGSSSGTQGAGVTVSDKNGQEASAGDWVAARVNAPANVAIWSSEFRGHTGYYGDLDDPQTRCQLEIGNTSNDPSPLYGDIDQPWTTGSGHEPDTGEGGASPLTDLYFGGYPHGSAGGGAWARFPYPDPDNGGPLPAGYRWPDELPFDSNRSVDLNRHMWGYFTMANSVASLSAASVLARTPRWVQMRLVLRKNLTAAQTTSNEYKCSADGRWRVVFMDPVDPVITPPSLPQGWVADDSAEVVSANSTNGAPWRQVVASDHEGSGVDEITGRTSWIASTGVGVASPVEMQSDVCNEFTVPDTDQEGRRSLLIGEQPCPMNTGNAPWSVDGAAGSGDRFGTQAGPHKYNVSVTDFAGQKGGATLTPAGTSVSTTPTAPSGSQTGWYWVDANPPSCAVARPYITNGIASVSVTGTESVYQALAPMADGRVLRRGSGIANIRIYKIARNAAFDLDHPSGTPFFNQDYLTNAALHEGPPEVTANANVALSVAEQEGNFRFVVIVTDGVGKRQSTVCDTPPTDCTGATLGTLNLYRGASGVLARWSNPDIVPPGSAGRVETSWIATITHPDGSVEVRSGVTQGGEVFIDAPPASQVDVRIDGQCTPFEGQPQRTSSLSGTECVDARPDVTVGTPFTAVDTRPGVSKFRADGSYDPVYEKLHVAVTDPNGFTTQRSGVNYAQSASTQRTLNGNASGDRARVIVRLTPDRASSRASDTDPAVPGAETYLVWEIGTATNGAPHRYWLVDGPLAADAYTRSFASLGATATCTAGSGRIGTAYWSLNCATSVPTVTAGPAGDRGTRGFEVDLDLIPRDNDAAPLAGTPERFPTPDRNYNIHASVRDQRQEADQRFLDQDAGAAANAQISRADVAGVGNDAPSGFDQIGTLVVDREQPTADFSVEPRPGDQSVTIANVLHVRLGYVLAANDARDVDPAVGDASPSRVSWTGVGQVWFEQPPAPPGFTMLQSGGAAPCDKALPLYTVTPGSGTRCAWTYTSAQSIYAVSDDDQRLLTVRAHVVDVARNERVFTDDVYVDRVDPIVNPVAIRGASGIAAAWPNPVDMSPPFAPQWRCDAPGPDAANPDAAVPDPGWQSAFPAERAGWTSSGICPGAPGQDVTVWIRVTDAVGNITVTSVHRNVDQRPLLTIIGGDSDPQIYNNAWDDPKWDPTTDPRDKRNDTVEMTVRDHDDIVGAASVNDDRVADSVAITQPVTAGDRGILVLRVDDPRSTTEAWLVIQPRSHDADGSFEDAQAMPVLDGATAWLVDDAALVNANAPVPVAAQGCQLGSATKLTTAWWEFDCSRFEATLSGDTSKDPYGSKLVLHLPVRALANTTQAPSFVTPDDVYNLSAWVRDQRQLADNGYLTQIVAGAGGSPAPNATFDTSRTWLGFGQLRTDRIDPEGILTRTGQSTPVDRYDATVVDGQPVHLNLDVLAGDIKPGTAIPADLDVIAGDIAAGTDRRTMTRFASGLDHVGVTAVRVSGLATLASPTSWSSSCAGTGTQLLLLDDARQRCALDIDLGFLSGRAYVEADILVVDQAGNYRTITRRFPVDADHIEPGGACGSTNGFAPLVDVPQGNDLQTITSNNVSRLDGAIATQNPMSFETDFSHAGQSGFGNGLHCGRMEWSGTVEMRSIAGTPWTPARPGGLDVASITTFQNQPFQGDFGPGPDLGERFLTYRAHVALDGSPLPAPGSPPTAITRRVMIAEATLANGDTRSAFIEIITRMPAVSNGAAQPARLEVKIWVGPDASTRRPIWQAPDVSYGVDLTAKCMHGCEDTPLIPF